MPEWYVLALFLVHLVEVLLFVLVLEARRREDREDYYLSRQQEWDRFLQFLRQSGFQLLEDHDSGEPEFDPSE